MRGEEQSFAKLDRDVGRSVLLGPLRIVLPVAGYAVLYPLLLKYSSLEVIGIWTLVSSVMAVLAMADVGFSQLLTRDAVGKGRIEAVVWLDYFAAARFYLVLTCALLVLSVVVSIWFNSLLPNEVTSVPFVFVILITLISAGIQLINKLDSAILAAQHEFYFVQLVGISSQILLFVPSWVGAIYSAPLEGLALGTFVSSLYSWFAVRRKLLPKLREATAVANTTWAGSMVHLGGQISRGRHFYAISLAMLIRLPLSRVVVVGVAGLEGVAVFDIAIRVTQSIRDVVANGLNVLLPAFNKLFKESESAKLVRMTEKAVLILVVAGGLSITVFSFFANNLFQWWLSQVPANLVDTSLILAGWQLVTLLNVPFWFILLATGQERVASLSVWCHTLLLLLAVPLLAFMDVGVVGAAAYWTASSLATQALIYYHVQKTLGIFWQIAGARLIWPLLLLTALSFCTSAIKTYVDGWAGWAIGLLFAQFLFAAYVTHSVFVRDRFLVSRVRNASADSD